MDDNKTALTDRLWLGIGRAYKITRHRSLPHFSRGFWRTASPLQTSF